MKKPLPAHLVPKESIIIRKNPEHTVLKIPHLTDEWLNQIVDLLIEHNNPYITGLDFHYGSITNAGIQHFANLPNQITYVNLGRNRLNDGAAPMLLKILQHVINLDISDNCLSPEDGTYLAKHSTIEFLNIAGIKNIREDDRNIMSDRNLDYFERMEAEVKEAVRLSNCSRLRVIGFEIGDNIAKAIVDETENNIQKPDSPVSVILN